MSTENEDERYQEVRKRVRARLKFFRDLTTYVVVIAILAVVDWRTGDDWWVQWVAGVWGIFLLLDLLNVIVLPKFWGTEAEERMIEKELRQHKSS
jgi:hypothetical protein